MTVVYSAVINTADSNTIHNGSKKAAPSQSNSPGTGKSPTAGELWQQLRFDPSPKLFELAPESEVSGLVQLATQLTDVCPQLLVSISDDLTAHAIEKKKHRVAQKQWEEAQTEAIIEVPSPTEVSGLKVGRPRMAPLLVLVFLLLRGWLGGAKHRRFRQVIDESVTLMILLRNLGCERPAASTIEENLNALSEKTQQEVLQAELRYALGEKLDDFTTQRVDSTHVQSASAYPTDSNTINKLFGRVCDRLQKAPKLGWATVDIPQLSEWMQSSQVLNYRICTLTSSSAKQSEKAHAADLQNRRKRRPKASVESAQNPSGSPAAKPLEGKTKSAKERKRESLYIELYTLINESLPHLRKHHQALQEQSLTLKLKPQRRAQHETYLQEMQHDLDALERSVTVSRQRVCEGKPPGTKTGMPLSVSDATANFIEKGGWQRCFGYRPQLCFSNRTNLVTALIVPVGNASDHSQVVDLMQQSVQNTAVIPHTLSLDDGYTGEAQLSGCQLLGITVVSFSGARGKALLGEETWNLPEHQAARKARNGAESGISALKALVGFEQLERMEMPAVGKELLEKCLSYNALKIIALKRERRRKGSLCSPPQASQPKPPPSPGGTADRKKAA